MLLPVFFLLYVAVFAEELKVFVMPSSAFTAVFWPVEYESDCVSDLEMVVYSSPVHLSLFINLA